MVYQLMLVKHKPSLALVRQIGPLIMAEIIYTSMARPDSRTGSSTPAHLHDELEWDDQ